MPYRLYLIAIAIYLLQDSLHFWEFPNLQKLDANFQWDIIRRVSAQIYVHPYICDFDLWTTSINLHRLKIFRNFRSLEVYIHIGKGTEDNKLESLTCNFSLCFHFHEDPVWLSRQSLRPTDLMTFSFFQFAKVQNLLLLDTHAENGGLQCWLYSCKGWETAHKIELRDNFQLVSFCILPFAYKLIFFLRWMVQNS